MPLNILKYILAGRFTMVLISTDRKRFAVDQMVSICDGHSPSQSVA